jgi:hypothetical protein
MEVYFSNADTAAAALMLAATACEVKVPKKRHAKVGVAHHPVCHLLMVHWRAEYLVSFADVITPLRSTLLPSLQLHHTPGLDAGQMNVF